MATAAAYTPTQSEPTSTDLAAYLDTLARCRRRLVDDIHAARVRLARRGYERRARQLLSDRDAAQLEQLGILNPAADDDADDLHLIDERRTQLAALDRLREITIEARDRAPDTRESSGHRAA